MKKEATLSTLAIVLVISLLLTGCFSPWRGDETKGTITITFGDGSGRAALSWDNNTQIEDLEHIIRLFNGPGPDQIREGVKANQPANFTIAPGRWEISVEAYKDGVLKAVGSTVIEVKTGPNDAVSIKMKPPAEEPVEPSEPVDGFIPVTGIINGPTGKVVAVPLPLAGIVTPNDATNQTIVWSVVSAGETGASISGGILNTTAEGTAIIRATIIDGLGAGKDYTQDFEIKVVTTVVPVTNIAGVPTSAYTGVSLLLMTTDIVITPSDATYQSIEWSILNDGGTGSTISGATLTATAAGTVTVRATITNGNIDGTSYTKNFEIDVDWGVDIIVPDNWELWVNAELTAFANYTVEGTPPLTWQWMRNGNEIPGGSSQFYTITEADMGKTLTATITYLGSEGTATSAPQQVTNIIGIRDKTKLADIGTDSANWSKNYILVDDIIFPSPSEGSIEWTPIGDNSTRFTGIFNGNGKTISNLTISTGSSAGMFGYIGAGGTIENLGLIDCSITAMSLVGGIAGTNYGTIQNCYVTGTVTGSNYIGGIAGQNGMGGVQAQIKNCYSTATVTATLNTSDSQTGGIVGTLSQGTVENCYFTGTVQGANSSAGSADMTAPYTTNAGGIVGKISSGTVQNCYSTGYIISGTTYNYWNIAYAGGIAGYGGGVIQNCYSTAVVTNASTSVFSYTNPETSVTTTYTSVAGGIVGYGNPAVRNCVALNANIIADAAMSNGGRVKGSHIAGTGTLTMNYGWQNMWFNGAPGTSWTENSSSGKDGEDYTTGTTSTWWNDASNWYIITSGNSLAFAWDFTNVWQWNDAGTPTLRNMPGVAQIIPAWPTP